MKSAARLVIAAASLVAALLVAAPTGAAPATCGVRELSRPFAPWLDQAQYFLFPGGDFETSSGWTLAGGAQIVPGNEPYHVHSAADARSLRLPGGAWARSTATCVDSGEPTLRFFARNQGSVLSTLVVEARVRTTVLGLTTTTTLPLGVVPGTTRTWQPSLPVVFGLSLNQLLGGTTSVDVRFTSLGAGGEWYVDDVYVDPFKDRGQL